MCDTLHLPARLVPRLRGTSSQPPSFWQRVAAAQERDECLPGLLSNNSPAFAASQRSVEQAGDRENHALALIAVEDLNLASRSPARLLITASTQQAVETLARRIHGSGPSAQFPFVMTIAGELPVGAQSSIESPRARFLSDCT